MVNFYFILFYSIFYFVSAKIEKFILDAMEGKANLEQRDQSEIHQQNSKPLIKL